MYRGTDTGINTDKKISRKGFFMTQKTYCSLLLRLQSLSAQSFISQDGSGKGVICMIVSINLYGS